MIHTGVRVWAQTLQDLHIRIAWFIRAEEEHSRIYDQHQCSTEIDTNISYAPLAFVLNTGGIFSLFKK